MPKRTSVTTTRKATVAKRGKTSVARSGKVKLFAPHAVPQITRGEKDHEQHYVADTDGAIMVPAAEVEDFLAMGCAREPQGPPKIVNHVEPADN